MARCQELEGLFKYFVLSFWENHILVLWGGRSQQSSITPACPLPTRQPLAMDPSSVYDLVRLESGCMASFPVEMA